MHLLKNCNIIKRHYKFIYLYTCIDLNASIPTSAKFKITFTAFSNTYVLGRMNE